MSFNLDIFLEELKELTSIESPTKSIDGVNEVAKWLIKKSKHFNLNWTKVPCLSDEVAHCLLVSNDLEASEYDLLILAHMDTVFEVGLSKKVCFNKNGDTINALGIVDDKAGALMGLYLANELKDRYKVAILYNSHEEIGSMFSKDIIRDLAKRSKFCFVLEPARPDGAMVMTRKGLVVYDIEFYGQAAHSGNEPEKGRSAVNEAANFITKFTKLNDYEKGHTFNAIMTNGGVAQNIIPDFAKIRIEMRYKYEASTQFFDNKIDEILSIPFIDGVSSKKILINKEGPMISEGKDREKLELMKKAFESVSNTPIKWVDAGGLSDGNIASSSGCPVIDGLGPTGGNLHQTSEYLVVSSIEPKLNLLINAAKKLLS